MQKQRIIYMGTPEFAVAPLKGLLSSEYEIRACVTQPDRARGRGKKLRPSPVGQVALDSGLELLQPESAQDEGFIQRLEELAPDLIIVAAYGKILPKQILDLPKYGCVNIHASLLPHFRGAAPVQRCILEGAEQTGVTLMYMAEGMDTGDMIADASTETAGKTAGELLEELSVLGTGLLLQHLPSLISGYVDAVPQDDTRASYAPMIEKSMAHISFDQSAVQIERLIRAMNPNPGAYAEIDGARMKIKAASVENRDAGTAEAGSVMSADADGIRVVCGEGILNIQRVQPAGKKEMAVSDYLRGHRLEKGTVLR